MKNNKKRKSNFAELLHRIKSEKKLRNTFIVCAVLIFLCIALCVFHLYQVLKLYTAIYKDTVGEAVEMTAEELNRNMSHRWDYLTAAAVTVSSLGDLSEESICDALGAINTSGEFDEICFVKTSSGVRYHMDGHATEADSDFYQSVIDDVPTDVQLFRDEYSANPTEVTYGYPVMKDGIRVGYLIGTVDIQKKFDNIVSSSTTDITDTILLDGTGRIAAVGYDNDTMIAAAGADFFNETLVDMVGNQDGAQKIAEEFRLALYSDYMGEIEVDGANYGKIKIMYSVIPESNNWIIVFLLFEKSLINEMIPVLLESMISVGALLAVIFLMVILISRFAGEEQRRAHELEYRDELTGSPNENAFKERAKEILENNAELPYVICCFDIQNFRYINEIYGHEKADILLKTIAKALEDSYSYNEVYARQAADRFISLAIDDGRNEERIHFIDEKINEITAGILMNYPIKVKTGLYFVRNYEEDLATMIDKANLARKSIDADLRSGNVAEYREELMEDTRKQEQIESRMEMALVAREFVPFLQPKWDMKNDKICGAEALIRWVNKDGSIVPPGDFIPLFEKNGFIEKVDYYMLDYVCEYLRRMLDEGREVYPVSVNQSRFLLHDPEYVSKIQQILLKYKIPAGLVELEITETVFSHDRDRMLEIMNQLHEFNIELSMDDFGSGYSSLNLLRDIPFDVLKIDRGFLDESTQSESGKWILRKVVEMSEGLNLRVICEGVETDEQVEMLLDIGCMYAQGFKYSRPIHINEFIEKYNVVK